MTDNSENNHDRSELDGRWEGLGEFLDAVERTPVGGDSPAADEPTTSKQAADEPEEEVEFSATSWAAATGEFRLLNDRSATGTDAAAELAADAEATARARQAYEEFQRARLEGRGTEGGFDGDGFEGWVPPWLRQATDPAAESSTSYSEDEMALGRFAYADQDGEALPDPAAFEPGMGDAQLRGVLEAILMVVNEPASPVVLAQVLEEPTQRIEDALFSLRDEYAEQGRGFELRQVADGWRFYTRALYSSYVERFVLDGQQIRLTQAALETLAVVAYKQPVTRSRVAAIRGVNCDGVIKTLVTRGLVEECGQEPDSGAYLYRTTMLFLEKVGINNVDELPSIAPFLPNDIDEFDLAQR